MKIQLIDVDSKIPNLALMKISSYHKKLGDTVTLVRGGLEYYPHKKRVSIVTTGYDKTYVSCIFTTNKNRLDIYGSGDVSIGGTGVSLETTLPLEIEECDTDYSIYPESDYSIGFISRGCFRNCEFCFVPKKEGLLRQVSSVEKIAKHKKVIFFDNNFLGLKNHKEILKELKEKKICFQFNQGLDIRIADEETMELLATSKTFGEITFSYDLIENRNIIEPRLIKMASMVRPWKVKCFLYYHPKNKISDILYRIEFCRRNKILPYFMRDISCFYDEKKDFYTDLAAWCNQVFAFKKLSFQLFLERRHPKNKTRGSKSLEIFND